MNLEREATILRLMRRSKRDLAESLQYTQETLADVDQRLWTLAEENRQLRNDLGIERGRRHE